MLETMENVAYSYNQISQKDSLCSSHMTLFQYLPHDQIITYTKEEKMNGFFCLDLQNQTFLGRLDIRVNNEDSFVSSVIFFFNTFQAKAENRNI